jgi:hypothetical protein
MKEKKAYHSGLSAATKRAREAHWARTSKMDTKDPAAYEPAPGDATAVTKVSKHTRAYHKKFGEEMEMDVENIQIDEEASTALAKKAKASGMPLSTLRAVYRRGVAAWRTGHRPGTTPQQWGMARVNSYVTKGKGTYHGADKDLREAESWEAGYSRRVVKTSKPEHKEKGYKWRIKGKDRSEISIKLYKEKPSQSEFNKQMKRVAGHEFGEETEIQHVQSFSEFIESLELGFTEEVFYVVENEEYEDWGEPEEEGYIFEAGKSCWAGYKKVGMKRGKSGKMVNDCVKEEAEHGGRKVKLNKPFLTPNGPKKRSVYVKNEKGNVVKVNFGDPNMTIKKSNPARRKSFRARHGCDVDPGPKTKAKYWSCRAW